MCLLMMPGRRDPRSSDEMSPSPQLFPPCMEAQSVLILLFTRSFYQEIFSHMHLVNVSEK